MPLIIQTYLKKTRRKGIGLFSDVFVRAGEVLFKDDESFDRVYSVAEVEQMPEPAQKFIYCYATFDKERNGWYLAVDNARFINHSENPNTQYDKEQGEIIAIKDLSPGEEITANYREFCDECKDGAFGFEVY